MFFEPAFANGTHLILRDPVVRIRGTLVLGPFGSFLFLFPALMNDVCWFLLIFSEIHAAIISLLNGPSGMRPDQRLETGFFASLPPQRSVSHPLMVFFYVDII